MAGVTRRRLEVLYYGWRLISELSGGVVHTA